MDGDDEFGDLYADIEPEVGKTSGTEPLEDEGDLDDEELLYGTSSSVKVSLSSKAPLLSAGVPRRSGIQLPLSPKEVDHDELLLYGQLYGVSTEKPVKAESPLQVVETKVTSVSKSVKRQDSRENARSMGIPDESNLNSTIVDERPNNPGYILGLSGDIPLGVVGKAAATVERFVEKDSGTFNGRVSEGFGHRALLSENSSFSLRGDPLVGDVSRQMNSPPGLSSNIRVQQEFVTGGEDEGEELEEEWDGEGGEEPVEGDVEEWDSDSEDDIHIVLNDDTETYTGEKPADGDDDERSEDEEDLVIVTGDDDALPVEEQEWEEQPIPLDPLPGASGATLASGLDRAPGGEDKGQGKGSGGQGASAGVPHIRYSGQGYHNNHMQYKYVRPGVGAASGMASPSSQGSPQAGASGGRGMAGGWGSGRGVPGRGEWSAGGGRGLSGQRSQGSNGMGSWGGPRGYASGAEFNLPPTKTVFDVDLDSLEEKPWRRPGVDITDYFNFNFTEISWKQYCRQLAQLRLEATMQSKIRVYESGRSEQEYDPDLPPELAAATGMQDASGDQNLLQQRQQDGGPVAGRGRGVGRGRMMPPAGRAIQVEGGGGERRPSADIRRQRSRDSDAIVLQDVFEDEPPVSIPVNDGNEESQEEDEDRGGAIPEKERRFYRQWEQDGPPNMWERENMPMGLGPMPNMMNPHGAMLMPGHRMDVDGPGSFPVGPGMPMLQPGPNPNFGVFPGAPFPPPSAGRAGVVRPPLYNAPRPSLPLQLPVPPSEGFPPMMIPHDYREPIHRRTSPHLASPRRTPPQGLPRDWDDEVSNGSGANWNSNEGRNYRERKDHDGGNGDWHADETERWERNHPVRRGREVDELSQREKSMNEASPEGRSEERTKSASREFHHEDSDWDGRHGNRSAKKQKLQSEVDNTRVKPGKEEYDNPKVSKSNVRKEEPTHSWEPAKERFVQEDDTSQHKRRDTFSSKVNERKGHPLGEDSLSVQRKDFGWNDRQDGEAKDKRLSREREEMQRRKMKEDDTYQHRSREDLDRDRRRDDQERERRHSKKGKDEDRVSQDERTKRHTEDHTWTSREREEARSREDVKPILFDREAEHNREKRRREEDRGKLKRRLEDYRDVDERVKGRLEDPRENIGRGKGHLEERRDSEGRGRVRSEDVRDTDGRGKGRSEDVRGKERLEDARESDGKGRGWFEDVRESDGRAKGRFEESRESEGRLKARFEEMREIEGRAKSRSDDIQETDGRGKYRLGNIKETDARHKGWAEDLREGDGRVKPRLDDLRESDVRIKLRHEDLREGEGRLKGRSEDLKESDGRGKGRPEDLREGDGRGKGRLDDVRQSDGRGKRRMDDFRESDGRVKGRLDDFGESETWGKAHLEGSRDSVGRGKVRFDEGRESEGRGRRNDKMDEMHTWDDQRKYEKTSRSDSTQAARNYVVESRKVAEEQRPQKGKRGWEEGVTAREILSDRNGSLPLVGEDKSYRSHTDGSKKQRVEEYRTSAQFDKATTRDSDDSAATSTRHKEKKSVVRKKGGNFARRLLEKDRGSRQYRVSKDDNVTSLGNGTSDEEAERRGRSKLERWTSRKERDAMATFAGDGLQKWQDSESAREEGPSTSQHTTFERKHLSQGEQHRKEVWKEKPRLTKSGKRLFESELKESSATRGNDGGDAAMELPTVVAKDATEKRKERLERLRLQAEELAARRQKNEASVPQLGTVEDVKVERPARKRRWGNG